MTGIYHILFFLSLIIGYQEGGKIPNDFFDPDSCPYSVNPSDLCKFSEWHQTDHLFFFTMVAENSNDAEETDLFLKFRKSETHNCFNFPGRTVFITYYQYFGFSLTSFLELDLPPPLFFNHSFFRSVA
ncbi:MAG: hypothetical protein PVF73_12540 [Bacteroidales bacterium]